MIFEENFKSIFPKPLPSLPSAEHVASGLPILPQVRIKTFDPSAWEDFTQEWASSLEEYVQVMRFGGAGDQGLDVIGCIDEDGLFGVWDNFQCKHYNSPLSPSNIYVEIGKIIFYSFKNEYSVPRRYYFIASQGLGTSLIKLLQSPEEFKLKTKENWDTYCQSQITKTHAIKLEGELLDWFEEFDFSIFSHKTPLELLDQHRKTPYYSYRFGGGLPPRSACNIPDIAIHEESSRYVQEIFKAYSEKVNAKIEKSSDIESQQLKNHFLRQRGYFYHAESLRNFARDTVPKGTFERLMKEIYDGVIEVIEDEYDNGFQRMTETLKQAGNIVIHSNPLISVLEIHDKKGICHHLTNEKNLEWVIEKGNFE